MKKNFIVLFALLFSIAVPVNSNASQPLTGMVSSSMTKKTSVEVKSKDELIQAMKERAKNFETEMIFTIGNYKESEYKFNPLDIIAINSYHLTTSILGTKATLTYTFDYLMADKVIYSFAKNSTDILDQKALAVCNIAKRIIKDNITDSMTDYEKEKAIHDYIVLNAQYDEANVNAKTLNDSGTPYGLLVKRTGICQAYAETMRMFMNILGIECETVSGTAKGVNHAWNVIKLDGKYYMLDVTWNDPVPDKPGQVNYAYFNVTSEMLAKDHAWALFPQYVCDSLKYNYYHYNGLAVKNQADFEVLIRTAVEKKQPVIEFLCDGIKPQSLNLKYVFNYTDKYSYSINEELSVVMITLNKFLP